MVVPTLSGHAFGLLGTGLINDCKYTSFLPISHHCRQENCMPTTLLSVFSIAAIAIWRCATCVSFHHQRLRKGKKGSTFAHEINNHH